MKNAFDVVMEDGKTIGELVIQPLASRGITPKVVDVGARSGMFELPSSIAREMDFVGFEPNKVEYDKLVAGKTDSMLAGGRQPRFKTQKYYPTAVWSNECERDLNITIGPGACSLMSGRANPKVTSNMYLEGREQYTYQDSVQEVLRTIKVPCASLDTLMPPNDIIDYLKVDVEGGELEVFKGAVNHFEEKSILFIKSEFFFVPYYDDRVLFGSQQLFLDHYGFRVIDIDLNHLRYLRRPTSVPKSIDRRPRYAGDVYFMLDPDLVDLDPVAKHRMATMLLIKDFRSLAISVYRDAGLLSENDLKKMEAALSKVPNYKKLKNAWESFPYKIWPLFKKIGLFKPKF